MAKQVVDKKKQTIKKRWFPIVAPKLFNEVVIGESLLYDASEAVGRGSAANLMQLTGDARAQNTTIKFSITEARDNKLFTAPKEYLLSVTAIKRLIRRKQDKIEDSISVSTSDGKRIRIKPLVLTRGKTKSSVQKLLRKTIRQEMIGFVRKNTFEALFTAIVQNKIQKEIKDKLNSIYPIKLCEIRVLKEEKRTTKKETEVVQPQKQTKRKEKSKTAEEEIPDESTEVSPEETNEETSEKEEKSE